jgi:hypothetical protein
MAFEPEQLLRSLNTARDARTVEFALKARARHTGKSMASDDSYRKAAAAHRSRLTEMVDEWISSGQRNGCDQPRARTLVPGQGAFMAQVKWLETHRPAPRVSSTGEVYFDIRRSSSTRLSDGHDDPIGQSQNEAVGEFIGLMSSPMKYHLAKCGWCPSYYFRKKLRPFYKEGRYFCPDCRSSASARIRTVERRRQEHSRLIAKAASALARWENLSPSTRAKYQTETIYLVSNMEKLGVGAKWVTRNIKEVRRGLRGGKNDSI